ncbi:MAG: hypothetical protein FWE67_05380 [Planctomycetaceae bacterium]|nr:hypothetical protein [Planctomycetaceae bacterium]
MKTKLLLAAVLCLLLCAVNGLATPDWIGSAMQLKTPMGQQSRKIGGKTSMRTFWDGRGVRFWDAVVSTPEGRTALGISDEQYQQILDRLNNTDIGEYQQKYPGAQKIREEMDAIRRPHDPYFENMQDADEKTQKKFLDISERLSRLMSNSRTDFRNEIVLAVLTESQKKKLDEAVLAGISAMPVISPNVFDALGLTGDQKQKMTAIKKRHEPEFEKVLESVLNGQIALMNKILAEFERQGGNLMSGMAFHEKAPGIAKKLAYDPEYKKIREEMKAQGQAFSTKYRTLLFDVLTDEQWIRFQELIDNPPEDIKVIRNLLRENMGWSEKTKVERSREDVWNPDNAIPEGYRIERNTR